MILQVTISEEAGIIVMDGQGEVAQDLEVPLKQRLALAANIMELVIKYRQAAKEMQQQEPKIYGLADMFFGKEES